MWQACQQTQQGKPEIGAPAPQPKNPKEEITQNVGWKPKAYHSWQPQHVGVDVKRKVAQQREENDK